MFGRVCRPYRGFLFACTATGGCALRAYPRLLATGPPGLDLDFRACLYLGLDTDLTLEPRIDRDVDRVPDQTTALRRNSQSPDSTPRCVRIGVPEPRQGP
jgi:hypothetical protein